MSLGKIALFLVCCLAIASLIEARGNRGGGKHKKHKEDGGHPLRNYLYPRWNNYFAGISPTLANNEPVRVEVNMFMREIGPLNIDEKSYRLQVTLRQVFNDTRLAFNANMEFITLTGEDVDAIWTPDTFIRNERKVIFHDGLKPNNFARVYPNGNVVISQRVTLDLSCPGLKDFETTGKATCSMDIASYALTEKDLDYEWKAEEPIQSNPSTNAFLNDGIEMTGFNTDQCDVTTSTGKYSCIKAVFTFEKNGM